MRAVDIIIRKRDGASLSREEIDWFVDAYVQGEVTDYQAAALLMAIFWRGMSFEETAALTDTMMRSGEVWNLDDLGLGVTVDKHSTGGVGDKVSLVLAPLVASCGVAVPMVSGRGLGHTGGTLDKLESIPGFQVRLDRDRFRDLLSRIGLAMSGQSDRFVPADKKLYALRDVTGTIECIPLICGSIMSKKLAEGAHAIVMDVKVGSGAFMPTVEHATDLSRNLQAVGRILGRPVRVLLTDMNQPLGRMVGNSLEVMECVECLKGEGPADLREVVLELAAEMLLLGSQGEHPSDHGAARSKAESALQTGAAWEKFRQMVMAQGGDVSTVDDTKRLDVAPETELLRAPRNGHIGPIDCREIGNAAVVLGAGRACVSDTIDPGVGLEMLVRLGYPVAAGDPLVRIFHRGGRGLEECRARLASAIGVSAEPVDVPALIKQRL